MRLVAATLAILTLPVAASGANLATHRFDLLPYVGPDLTSAAPESSVNLGVEFSQVEDVSILLVGSFTPGLMQAVSSQQPNTNPLLVADSVFPSVRLGEIGSSFVGKRLFWSDSFVGRNGSLTIEERLRQAEPDDFNAFLPISGAVPDYEFLLDGRFGLSSGFAHLMSSALQVVEPPVLEITQFELLIHGAIAPEPGGMTLLLGPVLAAVLRRKRREAVRMQAGSPRSSRPTQGYLRAPSTSSPGEFTK
ncbi:MAG: hypothetical protein KDA37_02525 [Planctomycetales bacterium]|nr:hypothetical protein [Planctomycetales bacterium]